MTDYISREAAKEAVCETCNKQFPEEPCEPSDCTIMQDLRAIPAADVRPVVRGRWEKCRGGDMCICSACYKYYIAVDEQYDFNYCPNCGADMRAEPPKEE